MTASSPTLHMFCGKMASGKSTLASELARADATVLISEDDWLHALYSEEMSSVADYVRCTSKLRKIMGPHVVSLLDAGVSVVLDFQANTIEARRWMQEILAASQANHQLHVFDMPDEICIARLKERNAKGEHPFAATEAQFHQITQYFVPPSAQEGFTIVHHRSDHMPD